MAHTVTDTLSQRSPEDLGMSSQQLARIAPTLKAEIEAGRLPGAVVAIGRRGSLIYHQAFGYRDPVAGVPMSTDTLFWAASMTKPMTVVGALMLYEQGRLLLNDSLERYLPQFKNMQVAKVVGDTIEQVPALQQPTILDLMRHTAGIIEGYLGSTPVHKLYVDAVDDGMTDYTEPEFVERLARLPLFNQPGELWHYGFGLDLLGQIIEGLTGQSLSAYLWAQLFAPLGMTETSFGLPPEKQARYAQPLPTDPATGRPQALPDLSRARFASGGAGVVTTASDYLRFALLLASKGAYAPNPLLGRKTFDYMLADQLGPEVDHSRLAALDPLLAGYGFGLGLAVRRATGIAPTPGSIGEVSWPGAAGTYWWADPREELAVVFMAHAPARARFGRNSQLIRALVLPAVIESLA
jgi:CubicO group peptidase (beta-lactamase class C family)